MEKTGGFVSLERSEVYEAIYVNDRKFMTEALEEFDFKKNVPLDYLTEDMHWLAFATLTITAKAEAEGALLKEFSSLLIEYLAWTIDLFDFLGYIYCENEPGYKIQAIPKELEDALKNNRFDEKSEAMIEALSQEELFGLVTYVEEEVEELDFEFATPIIKGIYEHGLVPSGLVFAFMAATLRDPLPETHSESCGGWSE